VVPSSNLEICIVQHYLRVNDCGDAQLFIVVFFSVRRTYGQIFWSEQDCNWNLDFCRQNRSKSIVHPIVQIAPTLVNCLWRRPMEWRLITSFNGCVSESRWGKDRTTLTTWHDNHYNYMPVGTSHYLPLSLSLQGRPSVNKHT